MARKKTEATEAAAKKTTKTTTKKRSTSTTKKSTTAKKRTTNKKKEEAAVVETPVEEAPKDPYEVSLEQIEKYKATHNGEDPGLDLEQVKKDAENGFVTILVDDASEEVPETVKATLNFMEEVTKNAGE